MVVKNHLHSSSGVQEKRVGHSYCYFKCNVTKSLPVTTKRNYLGNGNITLLHVISGRHHTSCDIQWWASYFHKVMELHYFRYC